MPHEMKPSESVLKMPHEMKLSESGDGSAVVDFLLIVNSHCGSL